MANISPLKLITIVTILGGILLAGCGRQEKAPAAAQGAPPEVGIITI